MSSPSLGRKVRVTYLTSNSESALFPQMGLPQFQNPDVPLSPNFSKQKSEKQMSANIKKEEKEKQGRYFNSNKQ